MTASMRVLALPDNMRLFILPMIMGPVDGPLRGKLLLLKSERKTYMSVMEKPAKIL